MNIKRPDKKSSELITLFVTDLLFIIPVIIFSIINIFSDDSKFEKFIAIFLIVCFLIFLIGNNIVIFIRDPIFRYKWHLLSCLGICNFFLIVSLILETFDESSSFAVDPVEATTCVTMLSGIVSLALLIVFASSSKRNDDR